MSYASKVKSELLKIDDLSKEEALSLLSAIMKVSGTMSISGRSLGFRITTENAAIARFIFKIGKEILNLPLKVIVSKGSSIKKRNSYIISFHEVENIKDFLLLTGIMSENEEGLMLDASVPYSFRNNEENKKAYIKGSFLGSGSLSNPEKQYHMEFVTRSPEYAKDLQELLLDYGVKSGVIERKGSFVVYIKDGEGIVDMLNIMGAHNSLLELENVRIMKDMRNNINRIVNCETANLSKTVNASLRQIDSIRLIKEEYGLERLQDNLREIAELRLKFPDLSLKELGEMLDPPVGKSGVNHRLRKLEKMARELEGGK